ncbi:MAG: hypothetical protein ACD_78C00281G0002 [uncultured bacterium (gcode 4)]|uniref:VTT domain-containing protein n=1 Tax=uncultured bacterium (gcode 4) TaxID=1234023 RepID=K1XHG4_9BACT|nr:MAG: hypothetical protein ACD_78C00281G0002 [uncultured bacterium (gcode 4)]
MLWQMVTYIVDTVSSLWYLGIFIMMTIESSFIPFPSEVAMIPAGYLAHQWTMNFGIALFSGTLGALAGATINYFLGKHFGAKIITWLVHRYGKYIFVSEKHYLQSEVFFQKHWGITMFNGRFIPAVRQLISIPAGIFHMNYTKFTLYTIAGAGIWNLILMSIGYIAGQNEQLIHQYSQQALIGVIAFIILASLAYYLIDKYSLKDVKVKK